MSSAIIMSHKWIFSVNTYRIGLVFLSCMLSWWNARFKSESFKETCMYNVSFVCIYYRNMLLISSEQLMREIYVDCPKLILEVSSFIWIKIRQMIIAGRAVYWPWYTFTSAKIQRQKNKREKIYRLSQSKCSKEFIAKVHTARVFSLAIMHFIKKQGQGR